MTRSRNVRPSDLATYQPVGDKKNSAFFDEYLPKIYERRAASGVDELVGPMTAVVIQVETGHGLDYVCELSVMTPYRLARTWLNESHRIFTLVNPGPLATPSMVVLEPLSRSFEDGNTRLNRLYPLASKSPNARYLGEIYLAADLDETVKTLESQDTRFEYPGDIGNRFFTMSSVRFSVASDYTANRVGYSASHVGDGTDLGIGETFGLDDAERTRLHAAEALSDSLGIPRLVLGLDHLATRVLAGEREDAILEFLTLTPYHFWGAYDIEEMNSSTNVTRNPRVDDDKLSPAKVFTANNVPSFVNSFEGRPMPTEDFVRNYGRRMHHLAHEVIDGELADGTKNVDHVVEVLAEHGVPFLADVVGSCGDTPDLKQIFSKHSAHSLLITEYLERCHGYEGFFTKSNVAALTKAAGHDERYEHGHVFD